MQIKKKKKTQSSALHSQSVGLTDVNVKRENWHVTNYSNSTAIYHWRLQTACVHLSLRQGPHFIKWHSYVDDVKAWAHTQEDVPV